MTEGSTKATTVNWDGDDDNAKNREEENNIMEDVRVRRIPDHRSTQYTVLVVLHSSDFERSPMRDGRSADNE